MKFATSRPYAGPEAAARKLIELANSVEPAQKGTIEFYQRDRCRLREMELRALLVDLAELLF